MAYKLVDYVEPEAVIGTGKRGRDPSQDLRAREAKEARERERAEAARLRQNEMMERKRQAEADRAVKAQALRLQKQRADYDLYVQKEERQRLQDEKFARETNWRRLMEKAGLAYKVGKFGAGWTWGDDAWADRLGVEMGYLKPWNRTYTVKAGGK